MIPIDLGIARVVSDTQSNLGINNITVLGEESQYAPSFEANRTIVSDGPVDTTPNSSFEHSHAYTQSTPTNRGQFANFLPPGNILSSCLVTPTLVRLG